MKSPSVAGSNGVLRAHLMSTDPSRGYGRAGQNSFDDLRPILERRTANPVSSQSRLATARELQTQIGWLCSPAHRCRPYFRILLDEQPRPSGCSTTSLQNGEFTWLPVICSDRFGSKTSRIDLTSCVFAAGPDAPAPRLGLPEPPTPSASCGSHCCLPLTCIGSRAR
jgi:hypothetical protein